MVAELRERIEEDARRYGGTLPREAIIAWEGYLAGLIEWDVLSVGEHERLARLLPRIENSPSTRILIGWEDEEKQREDVEPLPSPSPLFPSVSSA